MYDIIYELSLNESLITKNNKKLLTKNWKCVKIYKLSIKSQQKEEHWKLNHKPSLKISYKFSANIFRNEDFQKTVKRIEKNNPKVQ